MSIVQNTHKRPYPGLSPLRPELSQAGRTVLVTGGSDGIGYAIARAFAQANASTIVLSSRRVEAIHAAIDKLKSEVPDFKGQLVAFRVDVGDGGSIEALWTELEANKIFVDVLVLNAGDLKAYGTMLEADLNRLWGQYEINVKSNLDFAQRFHKQNKTHPTSNKKALVLVSSAASYEFIVAGTQPSYCATKNAGFLALQQVAKDISVDQLQVVSFHPGTVFTPAVASFGLTEDSIEYVDAQVPGQFAVWAASDEASFLHGRFVHAEWDINDLKAADFRRRLEEDWFYLKVGIRGLVGGTEAFFK